MFSGDPGKSTGNKREQREQAVFILMREFPTLFQRLGTMGTRYPFPLLGAGLVPNCSQAVPNLSEREPPVSMRLFPLFPVFPMKISKPAGQTETRK